MQLWFGRMTHVDTIQPADSVEFCPSPTARQIFAVGTYQLEDLSVASVSQQANDASLPSSDQRVRRWGKCLIFEADKDNDECTRLQEIPMAAVLDMKWTSELLAIADAEGHIILHRWQPQTRRLEHVQTLRCNKDAASLICLSLDWCKYHSDHSSDKISASLSNGTILIACRSDSGMVVTDTWLGHEFEPWITAWDRWDQNFLYTGGDDCTLKGWDLRTRFTRPSFIDKSFDAGVTSIQSNPHLQHILAVGSYDSTVRLFDMRQPSQVLMQSQVGGGAWRVKWHPDPGRKQHLLVACMHDGFKVIDFEAKSSDTSEGWRIATRFDKHESLAYGADWSSGSTSQENTLVASCSFYDHSLYLWRA